MSTECAQAAGVCHLPLWTAAGPCRIGLFMVAKLPLPETAHPNMQENARNHKSCARAPCFQLENGGGPLDANRHKVMTDFLKRASSANIKSPPDYVFFKHFLCPSLHNLCPELSSHEKFPSSGNDSIIETFKITNRGTEQGEKATKTISKKMEKTIRSVRQKDTLPPPSYITGTALCYSCVSGRAELFGRGHV